MEHFWKGRSGSSLDAVDWGRGEVALTDDIARVLSSCFPITHVPSGLADHLKYILWVVY